MKNLRLLCLGFIVFALGAGAPTPEQKPLLDFAGGAVEVKASESVPGSVKATIEKDPAGKQYLSLEFTRVPKAGFAYATVPIADALKASAADFDGLTMKVKGDGTATFGLIEIRADDYVSIYQAVFPLNFTDWRDVSIRWDEFFQMNDNVPEAAINWPKLDGLRFGSRAGWGSSKYAVSAITLTKIAPRPVIKAAAGADRLTATIAKLKAGQATKIVALGDSITFGTKVPSDKRSSALYFQVAAAGLEDAFKGAKVTAVNAGVGGDTIGEGIVRIGHQVAPENPDLVMVLLGANDAISNFTDSRVEKTMEILVDKVMETTHAEILLLGPSPCGDAPGVAERYARVFEGLAKRKGVAYLDLSSAMKKLAPEDFKAAYDSDGVHWSERGHAMMGKVVLDYMRGLAEQAP
jgi:lysophospholipase L1-like esterase